MSVKNLSKSQHSRVGLLSHQFGFTLAEVIIVLGIIGVVAALTIPSLMKNWQDLQYKSTYKKAYAEATQAWLSAKNDDKLVYLPNVGDSKSERYANFAAFQSYFKTLKVCGDASSATLGAISECWADGDMWWKDCPASNGMGFIDTSGKAWVLTDSLYSITTNEISVDINGSQKPNKFGQDRFNFVPLSANGDWWGDLVKIGVTGDCISASNCNGQDSANVCPSVASHPCYYSSWLYGTK